MSVLIFLYPCKPSQLTQHSEDSKLYFVVSAIYHFYHPQIHICLHPTDITFITYMMFIYWYLFCPWSSWRPRFCPVLYCTCRSENALQTISHLFFCWVLRSIHLKRSFSFLRCMYKRSLRSLNSSVMPVIFIKVPISQFRSWCHILTPTGLLDFLAFDRPCIAAIYLTYTDQPLVCIFSVRTFYSTLICNFTSSFHPSSCSSVPVYFIWWLILHSKSFC